MKYKAILFDMDGTMVPMDMEEFIRGYFGILYVKLRKYGFVPEKFVKDMWTCVGAMVKNDGSRTNEEAFWSTFELVCGVKKETIYEESTEFYKKEFHQARKFTGENPLAVEAVKAAREKAEYVILATNPFFPLAGQETRMSWVGLSLNDFDLVTSYESEVYCKPNPLYYSSICERLHILPQECLMIGNDEGEDMAAASAAGLNGYLVTDCRITDEKHPWTGASGTFADMVEMLKSLD